MNLIASADRNWAIGKNNELLVRVPEDMKFFPQDDYGKGGRHGTKDPGEFFRTRRLFPNRVNVVLTRDRSYQKEGVVLVHDMEELGEELKKYPDGDVFVIGGESIYRQLLDNCDTAYITRWDFAYDADAHLPNLDERDDWRLAEKGEEQTCFDLIYSFDRYERV